MRSPPSPLHNKSRTSALAILNYSDDELWKMWCELRVPGNMQAAPGRVRNSKCWQPLACDEFGRISKKGKKVCYGYQLAAFAAFGRDALNQVPTVKSAKDLTISHLCGNGICCNPSHLELVPKFINDQRTHCHFCLGNVFKTGGHDALEQAFFLNICPHSPLCCTILQ